MSPDQVKEKLNEDIAYLFSKINWGSSFLDADAIRIMNELSGRISALHLDPQMYNDN